jgi:hypothetical protein
MVARTDADAVTDPVLHSSAVPDPRDLSPDVGFRRWIAFQEAMHLKLA